MFNPAHKVAAAVADAPRDFRFVYSLRDIHRLGSLTADERTQVVDQWREWHRRNASMSRTGRALWIVAALAASFCLFRSAAVAAGFASVAGIPLAVSIVLAAGGLLAAGLLVTLPSFLSALAASALCDAYMAGYSDGVTSGVARALQITPEREAEMWGELQRAQSGSARAPGPRSIPAQRQVELDTTERAT